MAFEAIIANMDLLWSNALSGDASSREKESLNKFLSQVRDEGYPVLLLSDFDAEKLNNAISETLGHSGVTEFSAILSAVSHGPRFAVAIQTLSVPADRIIAIGMDEHEMEEARNAGISSFVSLNQALTDSSAIF